MATIVMGGVWQEWPDSDPRVRAYDALYRAAKRMGAANGRAQYTAHLKAGRSSKTWRYCVTPELDAVVKAMPQVLAGTITPEDAMALLWDYDTMRQRLGLN